MRASLSSSISDAVELHVVARRFARRWALRGVTLRLAPGEVVAVRGSNGSGKSTMLRIVASALRPTRGTCAVFGHDVVSDTRRVRGLVGLLSHAPALYGDLTVAENLRFAARMLGVPDDARTIATAIDGVALSAAADERARTLSSGMQRRVSLARLRMHAPRVLLLDEPYNSLDTEGVHLVNELVRATQRAGGAALIVSHEPGRIGQLADRVVKMDGGLLSADASDAEPSAPEASAARASAPAVIPISTARVAREAAR